MQGIVRTLRGLALSLTLAGSLSLGGCSDDVQQVRASDLNDRSFTFASGAVLHPALTNSTTTLSFSNNATNFRLASAQGAATGTNTFGSCTLTVLSSTYVLGTGPQTNDAIRLDPCDFDISNKTLLIGNGLLTGVSSPSVATTAQ